MNEIDNRIKLIIVSGFLGAGKSTWLRHQLFENSYDLAHVIVNEVAVHSVDDVLLGKARRLDVLDGGCVCCDKKSEMKQLLHCICNERTSKSNNEQSKYLIFEMSGVADPGNILEAIQDDQILSRHIILHEIIVIVDYLHAIDQLREEPLALSQIQAADRILIAKAENFQPVQLAQLISTLNTINSNVEIKMTSFGVESEKPILPIANPVDINFSNNNFENTPIYSVSLDLKKFKSDQNTWIVFSTWLSSLLYKHGEKIVRIKGVIKTPGGRLLLQSVKKIMQPPEKMPDDLPFYSGQENDKIVLIGRGFNSTKILDSLDRFFKNT